MKGERDNKREESKKTKREGQKQRDNKISGDREEEGMLILRDKSRKSFHINTVRGREGERERRERDGEIGKYTVRESEMEGETI